MTVAQRFAREGVSITLLDLELELPMLELSATKQIAMRNCVNRATNECAFDVAYIYNTNYGYVYNEFPTHSPLGDTLEWAWHAAICCFLPPKSDLKLCPSCAN